MTITPHNPPDLFPQYSNHHHAVEVPGGTRLLFLSGLNGFLSDGKTMPDDFEEQADLIWRHMGSILRSADMDYENIIQLRFFLADPKYDEPNMRLRQKYMGDNRSSLTTICCQLLEPHWKLEIEAVAAK